MISLQQVTKRFGHKTVTDGVDLEIPAGQMTVIIGKSGEGKSVLLKQIMGLVKPTSGHIYIDGTDITKESGDKLHPKLAECGYVFQFAALLDSLTVWENIGITFLNEGYSKAEILPLIKEKLALVQLSEQVLEKYPSELSGGMAKRVGLARTLITNPKIILYDEPTTGLDPITERRIHELMHNLQQQFQVTSVVVTHSTDLFQFADNIAFLYQGKIIHFGSAQEIWSCENPYVYQFIRGLSEGPIKGT